MMKDSKRYLVRFLQDDLKNSPMRFCAEILAMVFGIGATTVMAVTMPDPNIFVAYIMWEISAVCLFYGAVSRGSVGVSIMAALYFTIEGIGLLRYLGIL